MKRMTVFVCGVCFLSLLACSSVRVVVDYDEATDFGAYRTFQFVHPKHQARGGAPVRNPVFNRDVMREIKPILESKGFAEAPNRDRADLLIVFYAAVQNQRDFVSPSYRIGRWGRVWAVRPGHFVNYKEGTLVIDIVDRKKQDLVWQGVGRGVLDRVNPRKDLIEAVEKILEKFPPETL